MHFIQDLHNLSSPLVPAQLNAQPYKLRIIIVQSGRLHLHNTSQQVVNNLCFLLQFLVELKEAGHFVDGEASRKELAFR